MRTRNSIAAMLALAAALVLAPFAAGAGATGALDYMAILPGEGIGPVALGEPIAQVLATLGPVTFTNHVGAHDTQGHGSTEYAWAWGPVSALTRALVAQTSDAAPSVVMGVAVFFDRTAATPEGVHVGMTPAQVTQLESDSTLKGDVSLETIRFPTFYAMAYQAQGIAFYVRTDSRSVWDGTVYGITVGQSFRTTF